MSGFKTRLDMWDSGVLPNKELNLIWSFFVSNLHYKNFCCKGKKKKKRVDTTPSTQWVNAASA